MPSIDDLRSIRSSPRKMQEQYLVDRGIAPYLDDFNFPPTWRRKDQIDWVLLGDPAHLCYCGSKAKVGSKWCGLACKNKDPRSSIAQCVRAEIQRHPANEQNARHDDVEIRSRPRIGAR